MALACISPIIAAKIFGKNTSNKTSGAVLTLGSKGASWPFASAVETAESFGNQMVDLGVDQVCYDSDLRIFTSPA